MKWWKAVAAVHDFLGIGRNILDREEKSLYLKRYYLFSSRFMEYIYPAWSRRVVIHKTWRSDEDGFHNHPWRWRSRLLEGGYWEHTPEGKFWRDETMGWRSGRAQDFHRLELDPDHAESLGLSRETWSMFDMGPREGKWGFLDKRNNWVYWREYIKNRPKYI